MSDILIIAHLFWAAFMVGGFVLAVAGIFVPGCRRFFKLRTVHVLGIAATATVPLWSGLCPLTRWENALRAGRGLSPVPDSFLAYYAHQILYLDVAAWLISLVTALVAVVSVMLYFRYPPWKERRSSSP